MIFINNRSGVRIPKMAQILKISGLQKNTEKTESVTHHFLGTDFFLSLKKNVQNKEKSPSWECAADNYV